MKKIPYGIGNYEIIRENEYYFVDKTQFIERLESIGSRYLFFLRPRRFGKSLFLSMLEHYYDINNKDRFDFLFSDTYIGKHPTKLKTSIPVLKFNFSGIPINEDIRKIENFFNQDIKNKIRTFYLRYKELTGGERKFEEEYNNLDNATALLSKFLEVIGRDKIRLYLLIDEYDNFANNILIEHGRDTYQSITHAGGFLRGFFSVIKNGTESRVIERLFVVGVSPLVLSDVTSGFNIGDNISNREIFNTMIGFTHKEVKEIIDYYIKEGGINLEHKDIILQAMGSYYNNYAFSKNTEERLFNSDMVLYYLNLYLSDSRLPTDLIDENVKTDYGKLRFLITQKGKLNGNFLVLQQLLDRKEISGELVKSFSIGELIDEEKFRSLLFYLGLITIKEYLYTNNYVYIIPNKTIEILQWDFIRKAIIENYDLKLNVDFLKREYTNLAFKGEWRSLFKYILNRFYEASSLRDFVFHEEGIKMFLLAYLNVTPLYIVQSEPEMNKGFADIFLQKDFIITDRTKYEYIIELKYIKKDEIKKVNLEELKDKTTKQLERYAKSKKIKEKLIKIIIITTNDKLLALEAV